MREVSVDWSAEAASLSSRGNLSKVRSQWGGIKEQGGWGRVGHLLEARTKGLEPSAPAATLLMNILQRTWSFHLLGHQSVQKRLALAAPGFVLQLISRVEGLFQDAGGGGAGAHTEKPGQEAQPHELLLSPLTVFLQAPAQPQAPFPLPPPAWDPQT